MSETTTTAPAPPQSDSGPVIGPPPASQPAISVSEAARLLNQQRRKDGDAPAAQPTDRRPAPNDMVAEAAQKPADATEAKPAPKPAETGLSALERALGVPAQREMGPPEAPAADAPGAVEIEGQRYSQAQLREAVLKADDYTKKTQALAEQTRHLQAQQEALATVLPYIQPELAKLQHLIEAGAQKPDVALMETDPQRYFRELAHFEAVREEQQRLGNLTQLQQQAHQRAMEAQVSQANEVLAKEFPFWADPQQRLEVQQDIVAWATDKGGYSRDELRGLTDPRHLKTMMKAAMYDRLVQGARTAAPMPTTAAPVRGTAPPPAPTERIQVAEQAFEGKPNVRNAAMLLSARRGNGSMQGR